MRARLTVLTLIVVATTFAAAPATADDPCTFPDASCTATVYQSSTCGTVPDIQGQTCVRHVRVALTLGGLPVLGQVTVVADHEDATGEVRALNTPNTWATDRDTVLVRGPTGAYTVGTYGYLSASEPGTTTAGQIERVVSVGGTTGERPALLGARALVRGNEAVYCTLYTSGGSHDVPCSPTPVFELLP